MHPLAVYCALRGLLPAVPKGRGLPGKQEFRIRFPGVEPRRQIIYMPKGRPQWFVSSSNLFKSEWYQEIAWDGIPEVIMDRLTQQLVDNLTGE